MKDIFDRFYSNIMNESFNEDTPFLPEVKLIRADGKNPFPNAGDNIGLRNKLGGRPDWIQNDETPVCEKCGKKMFFYGQLDSYDHDHNIGDCGMIYVFYCPECMEDKTIVQSY